MILKIYGYYSINTLIRRLLKMNLAENYGKIPMSFESNQGQTSSQVKFLARGNNYTLFLTPDETVLKLQPCSHPEKILNPPPLLFV